MQRVAQDIQLLQGLQGLQQDLVMDLARLKLYLDTGTDWHDAWSLLWLTVSRFPMLDIAAFIRRLKQEPTDTAITTLEARVTEVTGQLTDLLPVLQEIANRTQVLEAVGEAAQSLALGQVTRQEQLSQQLGAIAMLAQRYYAMHQENGDPNRNDCHCDHCQESRYLDIGQVVDCFLASEEVDRALTGEAPNVG